MTDRKRRRFMVRVQCPKCACGAVDDVTLEEYKKHYGEYPEESPDVYCPRCGEKHKGEVVEHFDS